MNQTRILRMTTTRRWQQPSWSNRGWVPGGRDLRFQRWYCKNCKTIYHCLPSRKTRRSLSAFPLSRLTAIPICTASWGRVGILSRRKRRSLRKLVFQLMRKHKIRNHEYHLISEISYPGVNNSCVQRDLLIFLPRRHVFFFSLDMGKIMGITLLSGIW